VPKHTRTPCIGPRHTGVGDPAAAPLSKQQARALDAKIRTAGNRLLELVERAASGQIDTALDCSWRAWWNDAVRPAIDGMAAVNRGQSRRK
jgi:hypothetical protein